MVEKVEVIVDGDKENKSFGLSTITPALAQALYSQITNNSEKMKERCDDSLFITDENIGQLMHCMTIKHKKGNTLVLSGMDPYSRYNRSETNKSFRQPPQKSDGFHWFNCFCNSYANIFFEDPSSASNIN